VYRPLHDVNHRRSRFRHHGPSYCQPALTDHRYLYLPRLARPEVLAQAIRDGLALLPWQDTFGYAEDFDEAAGRYRGLRGGQQVAVSSDSPGLLVRPDVARRQSGWTAMRLLAGVLYPLRRNRIAVLGARSAPKRYWLTSQGLRRDIKGRALGWLARVVRRVPAIRVSRHKAKPSEATQSARLG